MIPTAIMPFRMIGTEHFVPRTYPSLRVLNPIVLIERHSRSDVRLRLRFEIRVLLFDLLDLLRLNFLSAFANPSLLLRHRGCSSYACPTATCCTSCTHCAGYWSCACSWRRRNRCVRALTMFTFLAGLHRHARAG